MFSPRSLLSPAALLEKQLISAELLGICQQRIVSQCEYGVLADLVVTSLNFAH